MLGVMLYRTVLTAAEKPKVFLKVTIAMLPLNAVGNFAFMNGFGPVPAFGPTGAGLSSLLVASTSLGILFVIARRTIEGRAVSPSGASVDLHTFMVFCVSGFPSASPLSRKSVSFSPQRSTQQP